MGSSSGETLVFVGTYTKSNSEGIYTYRMDNSTGKLTQIAVVGGIVDPSFVVLHPSGNYLYSTSEIDDFGGENVGAAAAYVINRDTGELTLLSQQTTGGTWPCHITIDATGRWVITANYLSGSAAVFPVEADGSIGEAVCVVQHEGGSEVVIERQEGPHAHSANVDLANKHVLVADLGMDKVMVYELDAETGCLDPAATLSVESAPGAGPRHIDFHPGGKWVCVLNEIDLTLSSYAYDSDTGGMTHVHTESTFQGETCDQPSTSDVHFSPDGKFVYSSNRGHHSLAIFAFDESTGKLTFIEHENTRGETPRGFNIHPDGEIVLVGNEGTDTIVEFRRDAETGKLTATGQVIDVPMPVCIKFLPL